MMGWWSHRRDSEGGLSSRACDKPGVSGPLSTFCSGWDWFRRCVLTLAHYRNSVWKYNSFHSCVSCWLCISKTKATSHHKINCTGVLDMQETVQNFSFLRVLAPQPQLQAGLSLEWPGILKFTSLCLKKNFVHTHVFAQHSKIWRNACCWCAQKAQYVCRVRITIQERSFLGTEDMLPVITLFVFFCSSVLFELGLKVWCEFSFGSAYK